MRNLSENQFRLFHGTNAAIKPGDWIDPSRSKAVDENHLIGEEADYPVAHATPDFETATTHGSRVYEVNHSSEQEQWFPHHYVSSEGFEVKREIPQKVIQRHRQMTDTLRNLRANE
jgi:hypothetical protein